MPCGSRRSGGCGSRGDRCLRSGGRLRSSTHRKARGVVGFFATGHGSAGESISVPWREIAALRGGTVVIYMGLANLEHIVRQLLAGGQLENAPCMVVQGATTGVQRIVDSTLGGIVSACKQQQVKPPALVIVGQVVQHRTAAAGPPMPLSGKRILTTCCAQEMEAVCAALRRFGAEPIPYPAWMLDDCDDMEGWPGFISLPLQGVVCIPKLSGSPRFILRSPPQWL